MAIAAFERQGASGGRLDEAGVGPEFQGVHGRLTWVWPCTVTKKVLQVKVWIKGAQPLWL